MTAPTFFQALYADWSSEDWFEVRHITVDKTQATPEFYRTVEIPEQMPRRHLFFGVNPRAEKGRGDDAAIERIVALYVDIDDWNDAAYHRLRDFQPRVSAVIHSGRGVHGYWFVETAKAKDHPVSAILKGIARELEADPSCVSLQQLLRVPGSINIKNGAECSQMFLDASRRYDIGEFEHLVQEDEQESTRSTRQDFEIRMGNLPEDFTARLGFDLTLRQLWQENLVKRTGSHQDFALALALAWRSFPAEDIARVLMLAPYPKTTPRSACYLRTTVGKAIDAVENARRKLA